MIKKGTGAKDRLVGGKADDRLFGLGGDDNLIGGYGDDTLDGGADNDRLDGGSGDDRLDGGTGADVMRGGAGNDTYVVDNAGDRIVELVPAFSTETNTVEAWIDYRLGANLHDLALKGSASDGTGNDLDNRIVGNELKNNLIGGDGNDELYGFDARDRLEGGEGDDYLDGGTGNDTMIGGYGRDTYVVDSLDDVIVDTGGVDTILLSAPLKLYTMPSRIENLTVLDTTTDPNTRISVIGNEVGNRIDGGQGADIIDGRGGEDLLWGGGGADTIYAGDGNDIILGSEGADSVYLGGDSDVVIYQTVSEIAGDYVGDFSGTARIDLSVIDAGSAEGDQAFIFLGSGAFTGREGELRCESLGGTTTRLIFDLDGDKIPDIQMHVEGSPLTDASFNF